MKRTQGQAVEEGEGGGQRKQPLFRFWNDLIPEMQDEVVNKCTPDRFLTEMALSLCNRAHYKRFAASRFDNPYSPFWNHMMNRPSANAVMAYCEQHWVQYCKTKAERLRRLHVMRLSIAYMKIAKEYRRAMPPFFEESVVRLEVWMEVQSKQLQVWLPEVLLSDAMMNNAPDDYLNIFAYPQQRNKLFRCDLEAVQWVVEKRHLRCFAWLERQWQRLSFDGFRDDFSPEHAEEWWQPEHPFMDRFFALCGRSHPEIAPQLAAYLVEDCLLPGGPMDKLFEWRYTTCLRGPILPQPLPLLEGDCSWLRDLLSPKIDPGRRVRSAQRIKTMFRVGRIWLDTHCHPPDPKHDDPEFELHVSTNVELVRFLEEYFPTLWWDSFVPDKFFAMRDKSKCSIANMKETLTILLRLGWDRVPEEKHRSMVEEAYAEHEYEFMFWLFDHGWRVHCRKSPVVPFMTWYFARHPAATFNYVDYYDTADCEGPEP